MLKVNIKNPLDAEEELTDAIVVIDEIHLKRDRTGSVVLKIFKNQRSMTNGGQGVVKAIRVARQSYENPDDMPANPEYVKATGLPGELVTVAFSSVFNKSYEQMYTSLANKKIEIFGQLKTLRK